MVGKAKVYMIANTIQIADNVVRHPGILAKTLADDPRGEIETVENDRLV